MLLRPTKDHVNQILVEQKDFQPYEREFVPDSQIPKGRASFAFRDRIDGDFIPSEIVVQGKERQKVPVTSRGR